MGLARGWGGEQSDLSEPVKSVARGKKEWSNKAYYICNGKKSWGEQILVSCNRGWASLGVEKRDMKK